MDTDKIARLDAYLVQELPQDESDLFGREIQADADLSEEFVQQARMDAALAALLADEKAAQNFAQGVLASVQTAPERSLTKSVLSEILDEREAATRSRQPRPFDWWVWTKTAAIAAIAAVATVWVLQSVQLDTGSGQVAPQAKFLARLTADESAQWGEESLRARDDGWLQSGRLDLLSGQAEVTFGSGARVLLEGPAVFDVEKMNRGFLKKGRLTAEVPRPATGFVINTPLMNVVDLGTRFGLTVKFNGETEVHVMQGVVEASRSKGVSVPLVLTEGLAVLADRRPQSRLKPVLYAGHQFILPEQEPSILATARYLYYGFNEVGGADIEDSGVGLSGGPFDASLLVEGVDAAKASPKRTAGVVGRGLVFEIGDQLMANGPPLLAGGTQPWSAMIWVKVQAKGGVDSEQEVLTLGKDSHEWKMRCNGEAEAGVKGALRADYGHGYAVGSTDLRDGRWHHLALVFIGAEQEQGVSGVDGETQTGEGVDVASHVRLYVDGKLELLSGARSNQVLPLGSKSDEELTAFSFGGSASFEGALDEFYLLGEAASSASVLELYELGKSDGAE